MDIKLSIVRAFVGRLFNREVYFLLVGSAGGTEVEVRTHVVGKIRRSHPWIPDSPEPLAIISEGFKGSLVVVDSDAKGRTLAKRMGAVQSAVGESELLSGLWSAIGPTGAILAQLGGLVAGVLKRNKDDVLATFPMDLEQSDEDPDGEVFRLTTGPGRRRVEVDLRLGDAEENLETGVEELDPRNPEEVLDAHLASAEPLPMSSHQVGFLMMMSPEFQISKALRVALRPRSDP